MPKFLAGTIVVFSSILLILSLAGIGAAWIYNGPLTRDSIARLREIDAELARTQTALREAKVEVERALRIVGSAEQTLAELKDEVAEAKRLLDAVDVTLDNTLIPGLEGSRDKINALRTTLEDLRKTLEQLNNIPFVNLALPGDEVLANIISGIDSFNSEVGRVENLVQRASTTLSDVSYLMGGDLTETKQHLHSLLQVVTDNDKQVTNWRAQVAGWIESLPGWIDRASIITTVSLLWFGFSQFGMVLYGLTWWRGGDPLLVLRRGIATDKRR